MSLSTLIGITQLPIAKICHPLLKEGWGEKWNNPKRDVSGYTWWAITLIYFIANGIANGSTAIQLSWELATMSLSCLSGLPRSVALLAYYWPPAVGRVCGVSVLPMTGCVRAKVIFQIVLVHYGWLDH